MNEHDETPNVADDLAALRAETPPCRIGCARPVKPRTTS
jgi:hypothetical protein